MKEYTGPEADFYDSCFAGLEGDTQFYVEEAQKAGSPVLELGCGTGRILLPIAKAGITIVGLDRAPAMLAILRQKLTKLSPEVQGRVALVEGDMRDFEREERFPLVIIPYRAFLHLLTAKAQRQALTCIREHLTDDGRLIFNVFDPNLEVIAAHLGPLGAAQKKIRSLSIRPPAIALWSGRRPSTILNNNSLSSISSLKSWMRTGI